MQLAVAPDELLIETTVPFGRVLCAHVPEGAASYHVAPPLCVRPAGAGADPDPDGLDPGFGADFAGAVVGFGVALTVVVVRRTIVVDGVVRVVGRTRSAAVVARRSPTRANRRTSCRSVGGRTWSAQSTRQRARLVWRSAR